MSEAMLRWQRYPVAEASFGAEANYQHGRLTIDEAALRAELLRDARFAGVDLTLVAPSEPVRIINIVDVVEPRIKPDRGVPDYYPGVGTEPFLVGTRATNVLGGLVVMTTALLDQAEDMVVSTEPGQPLRSRYAEGWILVVSPHAAPGVGNDEYARAVTAAGCRAAVALARATLGAEPVETVALDAASPSAVAPRLGYVCYLYSHGFARQKLVYGCASAGLAPTILPLAQLLDGAVVDNGYTRPVRNSTHDLVNNGVAVALAAGHGRTHTAAGLILVPHATELTYKQLYAEQTARIAREVLRCDGVVISKDGGGQGDVDVMAVVEACEVLGLRTVAAVCEIAGEEGDQFPVVTTVPQADALVSLGNMTEAVQFGPIARVLGGPRLGRHTADPHGPFSLPAGQVPGLLDMMGGTRVRALVY
jgi:glycine reductase complex component B subunit alpha and beta